MEVATYHLRRHHLHRCRCFDRVSSRLPRQRQVAYNGGENTYHRGDSRNTCGHFEFDI